MSPTVRKPIRHHPFAALALLVWLAVPIVAMSEPIPRPEGIRTDVNFWIRVYTEVTTNEGLLHDERNLAVVYDTIKFSPGTAPRERQRMVDDRRDKYIAALRRIIAGLTLGGGHRSALRRR
jgi:hypothetical protein